MLVYFWFKAVSRINTSDCTLASVCNDITQIMIRMILSTWNGQTTEFATAETRDSEIYYYHDLLLHFFKSVISMRFRNSNTSFTDLRWFNLPRSMSVNVAYMTTRRNVSRPVWTVSLCSWQWASMINDQSPLTKDGTNTDWFLHFLLVIAQQHYIV